ncbi:MAG TPA: DUF6765 family protein [Paraburkholderia sp.]|uniref:DUF6765 family protein n=1 Tax=Paraburkholderia sp. TaxID=1926495 RepID=UPI002B4A644E|nr:DUF6765 family protein [Paraburkholderia sp.]HKR45806.1 DUF6765 family protein [Paraburkholderia sp.]
MNIDFHYGVVYAMARLGGLSPADALTAAHACQYVDDATTPGLLDFNGGELFERFATAHSMFDYHNADDQGNRLTWVPFHFLPAGKGEGLEQRAICRPNSDVAKDIVRRAIEHHGADNGLHRLGVTLHTYVDTWAHQGFSGIKSDYNRVEHLEAEDCTHMQWYQRLGQFTAHLVDDAKSEVLSRAFPLGHGAALHYPDQPWASWTYTNGKGEIVKRVNLPDFIDAANMACRAVQGYVAGKTDFENQPGLSKMHLAALESLLATNTSIDEQERLEVVRVAIADGRFVGLKEVLPAYIAKGKGSWKHIATGIEADDDGSVKPVWSEDFERADYRKFHDAVKEHRFVVTQEILPELGLRLA